MGTSGASTINILVQGPVILSDFVLCPERWLLVREYYETADAFRRSVLALIDLDGADFHRVYEATEAYWVAVNLARDTLKNHLAVHGC